jgi:hypothetical protein
MIPMRKKCIKCQKESKQDIPDCVMDGACPDEVIQLDSILGIKSLPNKVVKLEVHTISKCKSCHSVTYTIKNKCGKCGAKK